MDFIEKRNRSAIENWNRSEIRAAATNWHNISREINYQYMFEMCGLPIIQDPQDVCMLQELIWQIKPTLIIETGIARGGSLMLSAMLLGALSFIDGLNESGPKKRRVVGIDIDIRAHNRIKIEKHPLFPLITILEGSSTSEEIVAELRKIIQEEDIVLVILDSNHTEEHVLAELEIYSPFVSEKSAIIVMDTGIEFAPPESFNTDRPWSVGANPYTATKKFLSSPLGQDFDVDRSIEYRHIISSAPEGLLRRKKLN
jgi:cephalosporin hydroxylase